LKKTNKRKFIALQKKREKKRFKRRIKKRYYKQKNVKEDYRFGFRKKIDNIIIEKYKNDLYDFFLTKGFIATPKLKFSIPKTFSIIDNCEETLQIIASIHTSMNLFLGRTIELDFSKCEKTDLHTNILLRIIANEYRASQNKLQQKVYTKDVVTKIYLKLIKNDKVNKILFGAGIWDSLENVSVDQMMPISTIGIHRGKENQKHYVENKKGATATKITNYLNLGCLKNYGFELTPSGQNYMQELISEVLNNAEDHGHKNDWFATATLFEDNRIAHSSSSEVIGQLCLTILNFGQSFF
jgi:hypothetical protein